MYLKALQMVGFKSFAEKTRLQFEPGMTCVVGPNGCGKSNIADAVRWVIGEQSAKALRGSSMTDCIFNGTDSRKPLGMAEVSITFADCESELGTEYNEITVTRRVFRDGQGQYFINKTACRLKDIQRLFMDTGVGTTSYSLMEQGRIDRVLSARPEDRRAVFEEASGITKFKNDKKEAIRKLDRTEANLVRLADVIREVKRQIGSLQRQAGKARRYKALRDDLRVHDIYLTRERVRGIDAELKSIEETMATLDGEIGEANRNVQGLDEQSTHMRGCLAETEREVEALLEKNVQAKGKLNHTRELIATNKRRMEEYESWASRDSREIDENRRLQEEHQRHVEATAAKLAGAQAKRETADAELQAAGDAAAGHRRRIDEARARIESLREDSVELETLAVRLQNELSEQETQQRSTILQRERLASEKSQLTRSSEAFNKRKEEMLRALEAASTGVNERQTHLEDLENRRHAMEDEIRKTRQTCGDLQSQAAARRARLEVLREADASAEESSEAAKALANEGGAPLGLDGSALLGAFVTRLDVEADYRVALETALRFALDAILVRDRAAAADILTALEREKVGAARLLVLAPSAPASTPVDGDLPEGAERLRDRVRGDADIDPLLDRLLHDVFVVTDTRAFVVAPTGLTLVTRTGSILRPDGSAEFCMPQAASASALGRKDLMRRIEEELSTLNGEIRRWQANAVSLTDKAAALDEDIRGARGELDDAKRGYAQKEGENQVLAGEASQARERLETVTWELEELSKQGQDSDRQRQDISTRLNTARDQRAQLATTIREENQQLQQLETRQTELHSALSDARVQAAEVTQDIRHLELQSNAAKSRAADLARAVEGREAGLKSYRESIERLTAETATSEAGIVTLERQVAEGDKQADDLRKRRQKQEQELAGIEHKLGTVRETLETLRNRKSECDVRRAEERLRRQNQVERVLADYNITVDELIEAPDPEWKGEPLPLDAVETLIAEARTKLDAMGPVNLVAIDEYKELEERYAFLTAQEQDLTASKKQLMEMIRKINTTTSEMFRNTFDQANKNFQDMFHRLFDGGSAKLVLVNEEDILDCGIEIIARPPGKRLQNVSLLSGGERTLTAVALLFAIYMIKPSPFCMLDELDAALDDANIGRFVEVLQDFLHQSQFIVITHNRRTISASGAVYGVTMQEKGVSRMMSMKFNDTPEAEPELEMAAS